MNGRVWGAVLSVALIGGATAAWLLARPRIEGDAERGPAPLAVTLDLAGAAGWIAGGPLTADSLRGRPWAVVVWSDTDPRSFVLLERVEAWRDAYTRLGLGVAGVHVPEFSFATDSAAPARVARRLGLGFPIALDPTYRVRAALRAPADRPEIMIADTVGRIVATGDAGDLDALDRAIREQLRHASPGILPRDPIPFAARDSAPARSLRPVLRLVDLGTARVHAGPLVGALPGEPRVFTTQFRYQEEGEPFVPYPVGGWTPTAEGLVGTRGGAQNFVALRYRGGQVDAVLAPPPGTSHARVWVLLDDAWLGAGRGPDVRLDARGGSYVDVAAPGLYTLVAAAARKRGEQNCVLKLSPEDPGVTLYRLIVSDAWTSR